MTQPIVFNLQKFCVHDGPGIRTTVFFKGCPLRCGWCHNPESQSGMPELLFDRERCTACGRCQAVCPRGAIRMDEGGAVHDRNLCHSCGACADQCLNGARELCGKTATIGELLNEIEKDRVFYEQSGGGVTFSGGEALAQIDALTELARACKDIGLHVAVDTCGHAPFASFERILACTDLFLYDIKHMDPDVHRRITGRDNKPILKNLRRLAAAGANISVRVPLIDGVNADDGNIDALAAFLNETRLTHVMLLPCHHTGRSKYERLGRVFDAEAWPSPSLARLKEIAARLAAGGLDVHLAE